MIRSALEKADNMQEQMFNVGREMDILSKINK